MDEKTVLAQTLATPTWRPTFAQNAHPQVRSHSFNQGFFLPAVSTALLGENAREDDDSEGGTLVVRLIAVSLSPPSSTRQALRFAPRPGREKKVCIGRDLTQCDLVVTDKGVGSGVHATLTIYGNGVGVLEDSGSSSYGTTINDETLLQGHAIELRSGDAVLFGDPSRSTAVYLFEKSRQYASDTGAAESTVMREGACDDLAQKHAVGFRAYHSLFHDLPQGADGASPMKALSSHHLQSLVQRVVDTCPPPRVPSDYPARYWDPPKVRSVNMSSASKKQGAARAAHYWIPPEGDEGAGRPDDAHAEPQGQASRDDRMRRRVCARRAYQNYAKLKPALRSSLAAHILFRAAVAKRFRAVYLEPLARRYAARKMLRAVKVWFAASVKQHCNQRITGRRLEKIMRRKLCQRRFATWKRILGGERGESKQKKSVAVEALIIRMRAVWAFFAWRGSASYRTVRVHALTNHLFNATKRTLRQALERWTCGVSWLWLADSRGYGLKRAEIRCLMHRRFIRWASHISVGAARWRMDRARRTFRLLGKGRIRMLKAAKRFWRWRVGLEAWWTWAGEQKEGPGSMLGEKGYGTGHDVLGWTGADIPFVHGDESQLPGESPLDQRRKMSASGGPRAFDVAGEYISQSAQSHDTSRGFAPREKASVTLGAKRVISAEEAEKTMRRAWFRGLASSNEQWWFWTTTAQRTAVDLAVEATTSVRLTSAAKGTNGYGRTACKKKRSAADVGSEFFARAGDLAAVHLRPLSRRYDAAKPTWVWNLPIAADARGRGDGRGDEVLRVQGPKSAGAEGTGPKRLVSRSVALREESKALRKLNRRILAHRRRQEKEGYTGTTKPRRRCATLLLWLPGGTHIAVDLFERIAPCRRGSKADELEEEGANIEGSDLRGQESFKVKNHTLLSTPKKGPLMIDGEVTAGKVLFTISPDKSHSEIPRAFAKHLLQSTPVQVVTNHSRAAAIAAEDAVREEACNHKLSHRSAARGDGKGNDSDDVGSMVSSVSFASTSSPKTPFTGVVKKKNEVKKSKKVENDGEKIGGIPNRTVMGRHDVLAVSDLLKSTDLVFRHRVLRAYSHLAVLVHRWRNRVRRPGVHWMNSNPSAGSLLALLHCCQALEVAGAAAVEETAGRMRAPLNESIFAVDLWTRLGPSGGAEQSSRRKQPAKNQAVPPSRAYLSPHACHTAIIVDDFTANATPLQAEEERRIACVRHFNISSTDVMLRIVEAISIP